MDAIEIARASRVYGAVLCGVGGILVVGGGLTVIAVGVGATTFGWGLILGGLGARGGSTPAWSLVEHPVFFFFFFCFALVVFPVAPFGAPRPRASARHRPNRSRGSACGRSPA